MADANEVTALTQAMAEQKATLDALAASQRLAGGGSIALNDAMKRQRDAIDQATASYPKMLAQAKAADTANSSAAASQKKSTDMVRAGYDATARSIAAFGAVAKSALTGEIPTATQAMTGLGQVLGGAVTTSTHAAAEALSKLGPEGAAAGAAIEGMGAVMAATIGTMTTLMGVAIEVTQRIDIMRDRFAALAGGAAGGKAVQDMIGHLNLPFATSEVNAWAQSLLGAGIKGKQLEEDIRAVAAATALMGESGGAAAMTLFKRLGEGGPAADSLLKEIQNGGRRADKMLKEMGLSMADLGGKAAVSKMNADQLHDALAKAMAKKGAGPLADMANTFPAILQKAQEGLRSLFGNLGGPVKAFMAAVKDLFGQFNKGSPAIKALKPMVTAVFTTLFSWATKAANVVRDVIKALTGTGKPGALTTFVTVLKAIFTNAMVLKGITTIFKVIAAVVLFVVGVVGALATVFAVVVGAVIAAVGAISSAVSSIGSAIVDGLAGGIDPGAFIGKMANMASAGLAAFKGILGIASPSKVMIEHGKEDIAGAAATGVDAGGDKMDKAMGDLGAPPPKGGKGAKGKGGANGGTFTIGTLIVQVGEREDADSFYDRFVQLLQSTRDEAVEPAGP